MIRIICAFHVPHQGDAIEIERLAHAVCEVAAVVLGDLAEAVAKQRKTHGVAGQLRHVFDADGLLSFCQRRRLLRERFREPLVQHARGGLKACLLYTSDAADD